MKKSLFLTIVVLMLVAVSFWVYKATVDKASSQNDALYRSLICGEWKQMDVRDMGKGKLRIDAMTPSYPINKKQLSHPAGIIDGETKTIIDGVTWSHPVNNGENQ